MQGGKAEEVTWEDQQRICAFGRFNTRLHEVNAELKAKAVSQTVPLLPFFVFFSLGIPSARSVVDRGRLFAISRLPNR